MTLSDDQPLLLLLDFDGTVCIGDGPVWAYAEAVLAELAEGDTSHETDAAAIREQLGAFLDGRVSGDYIDGYAAVAQMTGAHVSADTLQRAYRASRRALAEGTLDVHAPAGLADLLEDLSPRVERVLVTNAPIDGVAETLEAIGLTEHIDRIVSDARKPGSWTTLLPELRAGRDPQHCMAVGDIWANDLAGPHAAGCATALIDRFGTRAGTPDVSAPVFEELFDSIRSWAGSHESSPTVPAHVGATDDVPAPHPTEH
ncbi:HAD family hydrolase [Microbacterium sp. MPKO10]|uniref:HAD family hydrolase n=1 Tax=Microbacterium sp. MPKO10 TaxID=2989818 RepID=UPI0022367749|nr:HAD family hydrolase [Microbacterium sp. MPKO10]MCW4459251.1 HAD family hydrolase [Microbacterium sp. MPKO10]